MSLVISKYKESVVLYDQDYDMVDVIRVCDKAGMVEALWDIGTIKADFWKKEGKQVFFLGCDIKYQNDYNGSMKLYPHTACLNFQIITKEGTENVIEHLSVQNTLMYKPLKTAE